jgi:hypothetical protein
MPLVMYTTTYSAKRLPLQEQAQRRLSLPKNSSQN